MKSFEEALDDAIKANFEQEEPQEKRRASVMMEGILSGIDKISSGVDAFHAGVMDGGALGGAIALDKQFKGKPNPDQEWEKQIKERWEKLTKGQQAYYNNPNAETSRFRKTPSEKEALEREASGQPVEQDLLDLLSGKARFRAEAWNAKIKRGTEWAAEKDQVPDPNGDPAAWASYLQKKWNDSTKMRYNDDFDAYEQAMRDWAEKLPYTT